MSLDGKITKWHDAPAHTWTSPEESSYFQHVIREHNLLVMGGNTFRYQKPTPKKGTLRIVMTRKPQAYASYKVSGQLEFSSESPKVLVRRLEHQGFTDMLFLGGPRLASLFFKEKLFTNVWITIEPRIFGKGRNFIEDFPLDVSLTLYDQKLLNAQGTLLLKYRRT